jgi:hypothetical protein
MIYSIIEVRNKKLEVEFYERQTRRYRNDSNWVRPFDIEIKQIFDPKKETYMNSRN